jgi:hypothetical protein
MQELELFGLLVAPSRLRVTLALVVRRNLGPAALRVWLAAERHFQDKCAPILAVFLGR